MRQRDEWPPTHAAGWRFCLLPSAIPTASIHSNKTASRLLSTSMASILASCCAAAASTSSLRSTTSARNAGPLWQVAVAARRHFTSSTSSDVQQPSASPSSPPPAAPLDQLIVGDAPVPSSAPAPRPPPSFTSSFSAQRQRLGTPSSSTSTYTSQLAKQTNEHPYRLHVHASKHNTILSLCRDLPPPPIEGKGSAPRGVLERAQEGQGFGNPDADPELYDKSTNKTYGQTVARTSCGQLGFRKAQRSTFEAATKTALRMFDMIDGLEEG